MKIVEDMRVVDVVKNLIFDAKWGYAYCEWGETMYIYDVKPIFKFSNPSLYIHFIVYNKKIHLMNK